MRKRRNFPPIDFSLIDFSPKREKEKRAFLNLYNLQYNPYVCTSVWGEKSYTVKYVTWFCLRVKKSVSFSVSLFLFLSLTVWSRPFSFYHSFSRFLSLKKVFCTYFDTCSVEFLEPVPQPGIRTNYWFPGHFRTFRTLCWDFSLFLHFIFSLSFSSCCFFLSFSPYVFYFFLFRERTRENSRETERNTGKEREEEIERKSERASHETGHEHSRVTSPKD